MCIFYKFHQIIVFCDDEDDDDDDDDDDNNNNNDNDNEHQIHIKTVNSFFILFCFPILFQ